MEQLVKKAYVNLNKVKFNPGRDIPIYFLLLPAVVLVIIFNYMPIYGIIIAFQKFSAFKGVFGSQWVGFDNFKYFLLDENFWRVFRNTVIINIYQIIFGFLVPIIFALLLNEITRNKFKKVIQTVSYLPHFISWVVAAGIFNSILSPTNGLVNVILNELFGIKPIYFLAKQEYFRSIIVLSCIWKGFGMSSVYYLASLSAIDTQLYEASYIDGAGKWRQTWHITIPGLKSIAVILLILQIGSMVSIGFEQIFLMYNPLVYDVGDVISTYTFRLGIEQTRYSLTAAIGFTQSVINFILLYAANMLSKKIIGWSMW